jgi:DegV family protein with EDD domain
MNKKVIIASDSTCDLGPALIARYGVQIVPLSVNLGDQIYTDGVDIDPDMIYRHYEEKRELPKTAAPNVLDFETFYQKYTAQGYAVVMFTISSTMSSTYNNARLAALDFEDVYAVDTCNLSTGGGLLVLKAADMAEEGYTAEDIAKACEALTDKVDASFVIDDLEFLYKGGRCSALERFGANLLKLKPCITVKDAKMGVGKKYRGNFADVLPKYVEDRIGDGSEIEKGRVFVTHAGCDMNVVNGCVEQVKAVGFEEVLITRAGCTISSHCGQNTLGVLFLRK